MTDGAAPDWPEDAVEVGYVVGAWGIKGWIKVLPYASDPQALQSTRRWFLKPPEGPRGVRPGGQTAPAVLQVVQAKEHGEGLVAQAHELPDRSAAESLRGARIFVSRGSFPGTQADEYYWIDLIGLRVENRHGDALGAVVGLIDTGPHSVLRVAPDRLPEGRSATDAERLIPFVSAYVDSVSLADQRIVVDWGLDY